MVHSLSGVTLAQEGRLDESMAALSMIDEHGGRRVRMGHVAFRLEEHRQVPLEVGQGGDQGRFGSVRAQEPQSLGRLGTDRFIGRLQHGDLLDHLLAQVLDAKGDLAVALTEWNNCLAYATPDRVGEVEAQWLAMARYRVQQGGGK